MTILSHNLRHVARSMIRLYLSTLDQKIPIVLNLSFFLILLG
jgi:hypothetical protein